MINTHTKYLLGTLPVKLIVAARREKLLRQGKLPVVSQLCLLPKTTHDPNSFIVDISHASVSTPSHHQVLYLCTE